MNNFFQKNTFGFFLIFLCGIFLGWFLFHKPMTVAGSLPQEAAVAATKVWTCSEHPEIRKGEMGQCPICHTDLVPYEENENQDVPASVRFSNDSKDLAKLTTSMVIKQSPIKELYIYGKVQADEMVVQKQIATISGRLDKMMINSTGVRVTKGQKLAMIYSPEYVSAQQELYEAAPNKTVDPASYQSAIARMRRFGFDEAQIAAIEKRDRVQINTEVLSTITGIVTARKMNDGEYVNKGSVIYEVADLSKVWVLFDVAESDLAFVNKGDLISFTCKTLPGTTFKGNIQFINPRIDPDTRMAKVRVELDNTSGLLKPDMHATGSVQANLSQYSDELVVPQSAVLKTNERTVVYVKQKEGTETVFTARDITLGTKIGDSYIVQSGISEGEEIILQGLATLRSSGK